MLPFSDAVSPLEGGEIQLLIYLLEKTSACRVTPERRIGGGGQHLALSPSHCQIDDHAQNRSRLPLSNGDISSLSLPSSSQLSESLSRGRGVLHLSRFLGKFFLHNLLSKG